MGATVIKPPTAFGLRVGLVTRKYIVYLPISLQEEFREEMRGLDAMHDQEFEVTEGAMTRAYQADKRDEVTGLVRRRYFYENLSRVLTAGQEKKGPVALGVIFIDLDNFKPINDTHGHDAGDEALRVVGSIIKEGVRVARSRDVVARIESEEDISRLGGDEFLVLIGLNNANDIKSIAERLAAQVNDREIQQQHGYNLEMPLGASVGAVGFTMPGYQIDIPTQVLGDQIIRLADKMMYRSKKRGGVHCAVTKYPISNKTIKTCKLPIRP